LELLVEQDLKVCDDGILIEYNVSGHYPLSCFYLKQDGVLDKTGPWIMSRNITFVLVER
jgi:hypothetical protein